MVQLALNNTSLKPLSSSSCCLLSVKSPKKSMISLEAIQTSFISTKHHHHLHKNTTRQPYLRTSTICLSNPNDPNYESKGDIQKQELLARIAMLQAQKVRLTNYIDERSAFLTQFAEEATLEFDRVGENALKDLDEATARIMENIEGQMQAFEESAKLNRIEIESNKGKVAEFEGQMVRDLNEGMFFKSLGKNLVQKQKVDKARAMMEAENIKELTKAKAGAKTRKSVYLVLMAVLVAVIAESFVSSSADWRKVGVLGVILVGLITQFSYEQRLSSEMKNTEKTDK